MKAAYIFDFQYIYPEISIIKVYRIIHGSLILNVCCQSVWMTMMTNCKLLNFFHFNCISYIYMMKISIVGDSTRDIRKKVQFPYSC